MVGAMARIFRFIRYTRIERTYNNYGPLTLDELQFSNKFLIKAVQLIAFDKEIKCLMKQEPLQRNSCLLPLNPFLDGDGLLRLGGRLQKANISYAQKHPILLPGNSNYTKCYIRKIHKDTFHGGCQLTLATIRLTYWIINGRNSVKSMIRQCCDCRRQKGEIMRQLMGTLPPSRVNNVRPFLKVGIDFAGPIDIKLSISKNSQCTTGFLCVFVCMAVKAVHIEVVSDMKAESFIAALKRFISRRGYPSDIFSDCGSNLVRANRILSNDMEQALQEAQQQAITYCAYRNINWNFIPPAAPNFGGLWEAAVKSAKQHLYRSIKGYRLTFEELTTAVTQIEGVLNCRPICPLTDDPQDLEMLTPAHFLVGTTLISPPEPNLEENPDALNRWRRVQLVKQQFWRSWLKEYLATLQNRSKWRQISRNLQPGDAVLLKRDLCPAYQWPLGRIIDVHPGEDQLVRVVTVKTASGILRRPISQLCLIAHEQLPH